MFDSLGNDDGPSISEMKESVQSGTYRDKDRECDVCGASDGSMIVVRESDRALCKSCYNDPDVWEDEDGQR
jgi:formylmethanofuran dehydrogenase subunit E